MAKISTIDCAWCVRDERAIASAVSRSRCNNKAPGGKPGVFVVQLHIKSMVTITQLFPLGNVCQTLGVLECIPDDEVQRCLARHQQGDWGDLFMEDKIENDMSLLNGYRLLSAYHSSTGIKFWIITEHDRSATTVMLPEEY